MSTTPLIPALSRREREHLLPLPSGEERGEGNSTRRRAGAPPLGKLVTTALCAVSSLLSACGSPKVSNVDPLIAQSSSSARAAYERGVYPQAARFYEQALQRARANDDSPEIARNGYNLAACYLILKRANDADDVLKEALVEFERNKMEVFPVHLLGAQIANASKDPESAERSLEKALASAKTDEERLQVWLARGNFAGDKEDTDAAAKALKESEKYSSAARESSLKAASLNLSARVAAFQDDHKKAAADFDAAANAFKESKRYNQMAEALGNAAASFEKLDDSKSSADRYYRAARSLFAQGDNVAALEMVNRGMDAAQKADDEDLQTLISALFNDIKKEVAEAKADTSARGRADH